MPNVRLALRTLIKSPFVTLIAVISLSLGIDANATAIFSLFDQLLLRALPVPAPSDLVNLAAPGPKPGIQSCNNAGGCDVVFSYPMFRDVELEARGVHRARGAPNLWRQPRLRRANLEWHRGARAATSRRSVSSRLLA